MAKFSFMHSGTNATNKNAQERKNEITPMKRLNDIKYLNLSIIDDRFITIWARTYRTATKTTNQIILRTGSPMSHCLSLDKNVNKNKKNKPKLNSPNIMTSLVGYCWYCITNVEKKKYLWIKHGHVLYITCIQRAHWCAFLFSQNMPFRCYYS